jgi:RNA polymerase sigma factor (sigma-70 family)
MIALMQDAMAEFDALVRRFEGPLVSYATRIVGDRERARDVVQETLVEAERRFQNRESEVSAKWLFTVCRNRALNVCRKERRLAFVDDDVLDASPGNEQLPSDRLEKNEAIGFLLGIVATLPLRQQEALQLRFQNNLSYQEISEIMNSSVTNVGVLIHTALQTLRRRYATRAADFVPVRFVPTKQ